MSSKLSGLFSAVRRSYSTNMVQKAKKFVYVKRFDGEPKLTDFKLVEEDLPALKDGEYLCEGQYLSVDPYMRAYMIRYPLGVTMIGIQVAKILESRNASFPVGKMVVGDFGWRTHTVVGPDFEGMSQPYLLPDLGEMPPSYCLGVLGMPGNTAYFGLLEICQPKEGETVVVTGAAGAVGSHVGQIAKIKGCKVIGFAGSDEKCKWLKNELGFDHAFNYKTVNAGNALKEAAPDGVDCYFDNVGGEISSLILGHMKLYGRVSICGAISAYNADSSKLPVAPIVQPAMIFKQLKMEGFLVTRWMSRWMEGILQNAAWIAEGKLKARETVTVGFENTPQALIEMLRGANTGKAIVQFNTSSHM